MPNAQHGDPTAHAAGRRDSAAARPARNSDAPSRGPTQSAITALSASAKREVEQSPDSARSIRSTGTRHAPRRGKGKRRPAGVAACTRPGCRRGTRGRRWRRWRRRPPHFQEDRNNKPLFLSEAEAGSRTPRRLAGHSEPHIWREATLSIRTPRRRSDVTARAADAPNSRLPRSDTSPRH